MRIRNMYQYFEERPYEQQASASRAKNVDGEFAARDRLEESQYQNTQYTWWKTRELEGRTAVPESEGVWPINHLRAFRYFGDPGPHVIPRGTKPDDWPPGIDDLARVFRLHHYARVMSSTECRDLVVR